MNTPSNSSSQAGGATPRTYEAKFRISLHVHDLNKGTISKEQCVRNICADLEDIENMEQELSASHKECLEQARLNGMGSERETKLMGQLSASKEREKKLREALEVGRDQLQQWRRADSWDIDDDKAIEAMDVALAQPTQPTQQENAHQ